MFNAYTPIIYHVEYVLINPAQFGLGDAIRNTAQESLSKLKAKILNEFKNNPNHKFETRLCDYKLADFYDDRLN
ncbi:hypothetical protein A9996_10080 [Gelidibacter algens]|uniref:hypothetical protein n=1 Tax=Gelidibacter algens TaxID=49280 RepID=UPI000804D13A|nr:hypothetical protein [Gelidibacter algens]OBX25393.1 hypothetical protein A9996_10080 [Gelidibacter algens]